VQLRNAVDVKVIRRQLQAKRKDVLEGVSRAREMGSVETESGAPDIADRATSAFQREFSFSLSENEGQMLRLIDEALARLENGKFGMCIHCEQPIEKQRLHAVPWARYCIACQEQQDRGEL
jgi:DnaK suppressor protein